MIILIGSCKDDRENGKQDVNLCWLPKGVAHRFIMGAGVTNPRPDELVFDDIKDEYMRTPDKYRAALRWVQGKGYGTVLLTCTDTYVYFDRLLRRGWADGDYIGYAHERYASGGAGFIISPRAQKVLVNSPLGGTGYGDQWVGRYLEPAGINLVHDARFWPHRADPPPDAITVHLSRGTFNFDPQWMLDLHRSTT